MSMGSSRQQNCRTKGYRVQLEKLPKTIRRIVDAQFEQFLKYMYHPSLNNESIEDNKRGRHRNGSRSVRITLRYRALYVVDGDMNVWYWVGSHEDYNDFIGKT